MVSAKELSRPYTRSESDESKLTKNRDYIETNDTINEQIEDGCVYDMLLGSKPQPWYLKPIRKWEKAYGFVTPIIWPNVLVFLALHLAMAYYFIKSIVFFNITMIRLPTIFFGYLMGQVGGFGVTGGVHRLWTHRSYKAKWPLKVILLICYSVAGQYTIYEWVRDHRVHHKFTDTAADPHNASRGFFFSHIGWMMMKRHPKVIKEGKKMDMSDIVNDPLIQFYTKYFTLFKLICCWLVPCLIPWWLWGEDLDISIISQGILRYGLGLNFTWAVNSFAHLWGNKPYDIHIMPSENRGVSIVAMGEGWHNYHHTFPWDYKAAELGVSINVTTVILNYFAKIGWAYDLKQASPTLVSAVIERRGGSQ